ncbi:MAG: HAD-IC family P-type ATPase, partial [Alphaproteobacteria bacterium]
MKPDPASRDVGAATGARAEARRWHALSAEDALAALGSGSVGLSETEAAERLLRFGPNLLPRPRRASLIVVYLRQFKSPLIYLLLAATALSLFIGEYSDASFILGVIQINAVIGTVQEWRAESAAQALGSRVETTATVRRGGEPRRVAAAEVVPGDVVLVDSGAQVPADVRLFAAVELKVDESLLTGESVSIAKAPGAVAPPEAAIGDRLGMLFAGTVVLTGRATGVAVDTGSRTEIGRIAEVLVREEGARPPLLMRLERFARVIALAMVVLVALLVSVEAARGTPLVEIFLVAVALAISAVPEGLPVAVTVALAIAASRMGRRNVIVRLLPAVEGLGACTLIASDKTGTLTLNELTIKRVFIPGFGDLEVGGEGYDPKGLVSWQGGAPPPPAAERLRRLAVAGALCNEAVFGAGVQGYVHFGDTVDVALLVLGAKLGLERASLLRQHRPLATI